MDWSQWKQYVTQENIMHLLEQYRSLGFLPGILLPMMESILPIIPLFLCVAGNAAAYGFWLGFLYSWIGVCSGSMIVFFVLRKFGQRKILSFLTRYEKVTKTLNWMERHGFGMLFLLFCFPFTPSALTNVVAGISRIETRSFVLALTLGKLVMIALVSFIGYDFANVIHSPLKISIIVTGIFVLWLGGKIVESRMKHTKNKSSVALKKQ